jgi:hexosaminidase
VIRHTPLTIQDSPRFPWRGFLLDTSNHFLDTTSIYHLIDGMASTKLNLLHWHIVDSYSFPFSSEAVPELSQSGSWLAGSVQRDWSSSPTDTYSLDTLREIVSYCTDRGIRVMAEVHPPLSLPPQSPHSLGLHRSMFLATPIPGASPPATMI